MSTLTEREAFTSEEREILERFFTNSDLPVFGVRNLPEVVKGALFARYSRSPKSIRRLFLDEFYKTTGEADSLLGVPQTESPTSEIGTRRAEQLYERVFNQYGDDSVAQLGAAHIACENISNILTKILERGRLASYLEQSTRYIRYDQKVDGRYRYQMPMEIEESRHRARYEDTVELLFDRYARLLNNLIPWLEERFPKTEEDPIAVWRTTINAKACDIARGLLPAATVSNVGVFASGQAFELMIMRMLAHPLREARDCAELMLGELRKSIPAFLKRVDDPNRGRAWTRYMSETRAGVLDVANRYRIPETESREVSLVDWQENEGEELIIAAALYESTDASDADLLAFVRSLSEVEKDQIFESYVGARGNRRHKPGRAFERISYRFDVVSDYGAFRDLQRHRMLTIEWQRLATGHGYVLPAEVDQIGEHATRWREAMRKAEDTYAVLARDLGLQVAQYVVPFAYRVRFMMQMNAREAFHLLELRSQRQGHPAYRRICQEMHRQIRDVAGHHRVAKAMRFVDHEEYDLERLEAERVSAARARRGAEAAI